MVACTGASTAHLPWHARKRGVRLLLAACQPVLDRPMQMCGLQGLRDALDAVEPPAAKRARAGDSGVQPTLKQGHCTPGMRMCPGTYSVSRKHSFLHGPWLDMAVLFMLVSAFVCIRGTARCCLDKRSFHSYNFQSHLRIYIYI